MNYSFKEFELEIVNLKIVNKESITKQVRRLFDNNTLKYYVISDYFYPDTFNLTDEFYNLIFTELKDKYKDLDFIDPNNVDSDIQQIIIDIVCS